MFIDDVNITVKGGHGGRGITSFGKKEHSGPNGGNGGRGGDLYVIASSDITLLNQFSRKTSFSAEDGKPGERNRRSGKNGRDIEIALPMGTSIIDNQSKETIYELSVIDEKLLLCKGGAGGFGNWEFRSSKNTTPMYSQQGLDGEKKNIRLILKLIADYGLVGLPNAGKSSLLNELTNAHAKTADYPFTTLSPNLGVCGGKIIADIPGLIEGAEKGRGLGIEFLKHVEKVGVILHCISSESKNLIKDYDTIRSVLGKYNSELSKKNEVILLTKSDLIDKVKAREDIIILQKMAKTVLAVSIYDWRSLSGLKKLITKS